MPEGAAVLVINDSFSLLLLRRRGELYLNGRTAQLFGGPYEAAPFGYPNEILNVTGEIKDGRA